MSARWPALTTETHPHDGRDIDGNAPGITIKQNQITDLAHVDDATGDPHGQYVLESVIAWQDWTPDQQFWTLGNGTLTARYVELGKTVIAEFDLVLGSTSTISAGFSTNYPVTPAATFADNRHSIGLATYLDSGASTFYAGRMRPASTTRLRFHYHDTSGSAAVETVVSDTAPFTFATNDVITFTVIYEAA